MSKVILILSKRFPLTHPRKGEPTGYVEKVQSGEKIHTIRSNFDRWSHCLDKIESGKSFKLCLREWSGRPYHSKQSDIDAAVETVHYQRITLRWNAEQQRITAMIDRQHLYEDITEIAHNDGLSVEDFTNWFFPNRPTEDRSFTGIIIHFTNYSYNGV